jgi:hypothetical protein
MSSYEMEMEDFLTDLKRKQNQDLREQNSRLTLALDEALAIARVIAAATKRRKHFEQQSRRGNAGRAGGLWGVLPSLLGQQFRIDAMAVSIVRLYRESDELRASLAMVEAERDLLRVQVQAGEQLGLALVKTIDELKTEKAELAVKLVNLEGRSRRATLDEIAESVREKYDERYEGEGMDNE